MADNAKSAVVLGAGVSGLTAAYALSKKGYKVTVLEKNGFAGGLAATFRHGDYLLDYGPHNFHTHIPKVLSFVRDELGVELKRIPVTSSKLFFMGRFVEYPLKIQNAIRNLDIGTAFMCFAGYVKSRLAMRLGLRTLPDDSFENWIVNRFGRRLYDLYFGPYVRKVWGIPGTELDVTVAQKRIPSPSLFAMVVRTLTGIRLGKKHSEDPSVIESYYPPKGIGTISDRLRERIEASGGKVLTSAETTAVHLSLSGPQRVEYSLGGKSSAEAADYVINAMPLDRFAGLVRGAGPAPDAGALRYRSIILLYMFLTKDKIFDDPWIYFNEKDNPDLIFNRVYEVGGFSREMLGKNKGVLCLEITCYKGDEIWNRTDRELFDKCMEYMEKHGFMKHSDVAEILTKRLDVAYPVFRKGYRRALTGALDWLAGAGRVFCVGRQGLFSYSNVDHCIDMGLRLGALFDKGEPSYGDFLKAYADYLS